MARWYIIHAYSGFENKVRDSIITEAERLGLSQLVEAVEVVAEAPQDPELYADVPSLVTVTQIREAMEELAAEYREKDDGLQALKVR